MADIKDKITVLKEKLDCLDSNTIDDFYNKVCVVVSQNINAKNDSRTEKYNILLIFLNKILVNMGKNAIDDITKFIDIDRIDIIKDTNKQILYDMESEIFKSFDRTKCAWQRRTTTKFYIITFLKNACQDIGYCFNYTHRDITEKINGMNYRKTHVFYSIVLN